MRWGSDPFSLLWSVFWPCKADDIQQLAAFTFCILLRVAMKTSKSLGVFFNTLGILWTDLDLGATSASMSHRLQKYYSTQPFFFLFSHERVVLVCSTNTGFTRGELVPNSTRQA